MQTTKPSHAITNAWSHYDGWALAYELFNISTAEGLSRSQTICSWLGINPAQRIADLQDVASDYIRESALSAEVRSGWQQAGDEKMDPTHYRIVFSTGGPHLELQGELNRWHEAETFEVHASDWSEHHELETDRHGKDFSEDVLQWVASCIYWGE